MTHKDTSGPAFPVPEQNRLSDGTYCNEGMTLRDYFAGQAVAGILAGYWGNPAMGGLTQRCIANESYAVADAMLEARK